MENFKIKIPHIGVKRDLTIIYKEGENSLHEMKTSKDELLRTLRFFQKKSNEINQTKLIYIQEDITFDIFSDFISSISTKEVELNDKNYQNYYYLSRKYEYIELQEQIEEFIQNRPDLFTTINHLISQSAQTLNKSDPNDPKSSLDDETDPVKEELIAKNLDVSIKNGLIKKLPIQILIRILNSPKRVIKDHHLLFAFVIDYIKEKESQSLSDFERESLSLLPGVLDYSEMTSEEIEEFLGLRNCDAFFSPKNAHRKMRELVLSAKELSATVARLEASERRHSEQVAELRGLVEELARKSEARLREEAEKMAQALRQQREEDGRRMAKIEESMRAQAKGEELARKFEARLREEAEKMAQALRQQREEDGRRMVKIEESMRALSARLLENEKMTKECEKAAKKAAELATAVECPSGVFKYLFDKYGANPASRGLVEIDGSHYTDGEKKTSINVIDPKWTGDYWVSCDAENSYFQIDFKKSLVKVSRYKIRVGDTRNNQLFKSWTLTGTSERNEEVVLDSVSNMEEITRSHPEAAVSIQDRPFVRSIRLTMRGRNTDNDFFMCVRNIELFGYLRTPLAA